MFEKMALLSKEATPQKYKDFYDEWIKTYQNTFGKFYPIPTPETYKEFYTLWLDIYNEIYGKYVKSMEPTGEMFEHFVESSDIYLGMYKSWIASLEKMYEKAFDSFFEDMPTIGGPMREVMELINSLILINLKYALRLHASK